MKMQIQKIPGRPGYGRTKKLKYVHRVKPKVSGGTSPLVRTPWFKKFMEENPKAIRAFLKARREDIHEYRGEKGIVVSRLYRPGSAFHGHSKFWRVNVGGRSFMVIEVKKHPISGKRPKHAWGAQQILEMRKLQTILPKTKNIEIARYRLGFENKETTFLVTDFHDLQKFHITELPNELAREVIEFERTAKHELKINDVESRAFYDPVRKKIVILEPQQKVDEPW